MYYWGVAITYLILLVLAAVAHEFAHIRTMKSYGKNVRVHWDKGLVIGKHEDYEDLTMPQLYAVYRNGVYTGAAVIILSIFILRDGIYLFTLIPYFAFCRSDFKNMKITEVEE